MYDSYRKKTIFPHRYSKIFADFWWSKTALWQSFIDRLKILESIEMRNSSLEELPNTQYFKDFGTVQGDMKVFLSGEWDDEGGVGICIQSINEKDKYPFWDCYFCFGWLASIGMCLGGMKLWCIFDS